MTRQKAQYHQERTGIKVVGMLALLILIAPVYAAEATFTTYSAADMISNFAKQIPNLTRFVTALAYVMGMYFIFIGVLALKHAGEMRSMMSPEHSIKRPLIYLTIGALLLYLPSSVQVGLSTFFSNQFPLDYPQSSGQWNGFFYTCFMIVQFVGVIAFIRGLLILGQLAGQGGHQGAFGKGMTHIIGGIFCINIVQFVQVVGATLGLDITF